MQPQTEPFETAQIQTPTDNHLGNNSFTQEPNSYAQSSHAQETKITATEKQTYLNQNSSSKIWSNIETNKTKEVREIIQIQEKSSASQVDSAENVTEQYITTTYQKPFYIIEPRPREEYWNKESIQPNESYLKDEIQQQQNSIIHQAQMQRLFPNGDQNSKDYKQMLKKALGILMKKHSNLPGGYNIIQLVELLYKKYIIRPVKQYHGEIEKVDLFKPDLIRGQKYYRINDPSIKSQSKLKTNHPDPFNIIKRNPHARTFGQIHGYPIDSESTNSNGDYYQNIQNMASRYVGGMRRQKLAEPQQRPKSPPKNPFEKKPLVRPELALPFNIEIPQTTGRKQFNPGFNFQSADQDKNERFEEQRTIAKTFVKDGYGLQIVRNYMPNVDGGAYNRAITTIIRESYKKIEDFLLKQCNIKIHSLTSSEFSLVKTPLVHCRNILTDEDRSTFFKYIAITYKFGKMRPDAFPTADQTLRLYKAIVRGLNERRAAKEMNPKSSKEKDMYFNR